MNRHIPSHAKAAYIFNYSLKNIPKQGNGEDTFYLSRNIMAVCDGVGSWKQLGVDAGAYALALVKNIRQLYSKNSLFYIEDPKALIKEAVSLTHQIGSATVTILTLHPQTGQMCAAYLGDSVFQIYRKNSQGNAFMVYRGFETQQKFNCPCQVGTNGNHPSQAAVNFIPNLKIADIVVLASDGLWDNVFDQNVANEVANQSSLDDLAHTLAKMAKMNSQNPMFESPFYRKAQKDNVIVLVGGKSDDITVLVAQITVGGH